MQFSETGNSAPYFFSKRQLVQTGILKSLVNVLFFSLCLVSHFKNNNNKNLYMSIIPILQYTIFKN